MRAVLIIALCAGGCIKAGTFECTSDPQCTRAGVQGSCEQVGFCSFPDGACPSGRRFGDVSGSYTQQCVGAAGVGIPIPVGLGCPTGYASLTGIPDHVYRRIGTASSWQDQVMACQADGSNVYLAVPDNATELAGILSLASTSTWVGVDDLATENSFLTVLGSTATFLPWAALQPDDSGGGSDCVLALSPSATYDDRRCSTSEIAICECEP